MAIPSPEPGLVINYAYLWHHEHRAGAEEGRKDRPAVIVLSVETHGGETSVTVLPITHRTPANMAAAVEIPASVKRNLGLDDAPSWIVVDEGNDFIRPGYDLRRLPDGRYAHGFLPPRLFDRVRKTFVDVYREGKARMTPRD